MSRIPSGPPYSQQLPPQPSAGYYGNPLPPVMQQGLPPPPGLGGSYPTDPNLYPFERHPQSMNNGGVPWSNSGPMPGPGPPGQPGIPISIESYQNNATAGPSRPSTAGGDPYQAYSQPIRSSPSQPIPPRQQPIHPITTSIGGPWSSVHPISNTTSNRGGGVKLEDLVSNSDRRSAPQLLPVSTNPPTVPAAAENGKRPGTSGNEAGAAGGTGAAAAGGGQQGPSEFIKKLYKMLEEETTVYGKGKASGQARDKGGKRGSVGWGRGGTSFVVWDMNDFTTNVLPQTFRHSNFSSFVRQLNKYGFSKIKHVDEESGTIKENVWEFQHPSFQAGGKSDLENIKRKAVATRKTAGEGDDTSPKAFGLSGEDASRINVMENRIVSLEGKLERALDEVREARTRESGVMSVLKEVIGHLAASERGTSASPMSDGNYSPRILHLFKAFDSISQPGIRSAPSTGYGPPPSALPYPSQPPSQLPSHYSMGPAPSFNPLFTNGGTTQTSPRTDGGSRGSRGSMSGPTPAGGMRNVSGAPSRLGSISGPSTIAPPAQQPPAQTVLPPATTLPLASANQLQSDLVPKEEIIEATPEMPALYTGEPLGITPMFTETPAWLTEGNQTTMPMYHRKSSDGSTLRMMYDALSGGGVSNANNSGRFAEENNQLPLSGSGSGNNGEVPNGLKSIPEQESVNNNDGINQQQQQQVNQIVDMVIPPPGGFDTADLSDIKGTSAVSVEASSTTGGLSNGITATSSTSPPNGSSSSSSKLTKKSNNHGGTVIKPHWTTTPKILVVEDDLVYRQLSSKFLSKFGCVTETVENAQGAIEKMNKVKYDLVLMDIFFGPNMDGRKATSLIRQFDNYTPIISMTSNAQPQDVDSYIRSGMNDILAKPFTKHGLFLILDKHLMHLRQAQIYEKIIPISVGVPPLSDQHVQEALAISAATIQNQGNAGLLMGFNSDLINPSLNGNGLNSTNTSTNGNGTGVNGDNNDHDHDHDEVIMRNPLAGSGWSDEMYGIVLQQFLTTGTIPDPNTLSTGSIGTGIILDPSGFNLNPNQANNRKRSIEVLNDDGSVNVNVNNIGGSELDYNTIQTQQQQQLNGNDQQSGTGMPISGFGMLNGITIGFVPSGTLMTPTSTMNSGDSEREHKRARGMVG